VTELDPDLLDRNQILSDPDLFGRIGVRRLGPDPDPYPGL
jgi:hypothetical protein